MKPKAHITITETQNTFEEMVDNPVNELIPLKYLPLSFDFLVSTVELLSLDVLIWSRAAV